MTPARNTKLRPVGNSVGVTLTVDELAAAGMAKNHPVSISVEAGVITIRSAWTPVIFTVEEAYALAAGDTQSGPGADAVEKLRLAGRNVDGLVHEGQAKKHGKSGT